MNALRWGLFLIVLLAMAGPMTAQERRGCTNAEEAGFEDWLARFATLLDDEPGFTQAMVNSAMYLAVGEEEFGGSSCDQIRADYYETAALYYSYYSLAFSRMVMGLGDLTTDDIGRLDQAFLDFHDRLLESARSEVTETFPFSYTE